MQESIEGGMYGALSILGRHERRPDREFVVFFEPTHDFMTINGRAFLGNTPIFRARVGDRVQWDVIALGASSTPSTSTATAGGRPTARREDTQTSARRRASASAGSRTRPGTWLYHCHVENHMATG